jgi:hypothetical protein
MHVIPIHAYVKDENSSHFKQTNTEDRPWQIPHTQTQLKTVAYMNVTPSEMLLRGRRSRTHSYCSTINHQSLFCLVTPNFHRSTCTSMRFVSMLPCSALQEADKASNVFSVRSLSSVRCSQSSCCLLALCQPVPSGSNGTRNLSTPTFSNFNFF